MIIVQENKLTESVNIADLTDAVLEKLAKTVKSADINFNFGSAKGSLIAAIKPLNYKRAKLVLFLNAPIYPFATIGIGQNQINLMDNNGSLVETILYSLCEINENTVKLKDSRTGYYINIKYR